MKTAGQLALRLGAIDRIGSRTLKPALAYRSTSALTDVVIADVPANVPNANWRDRPTGGALKRAFDILVALSAIIFLAPVFLLIAVCVRLHDGGPILYGHSRVGRGGATFKCLKFRSMAVNSQQLLDAHLKANPSAAAEWRRTFKLRADPRITPIGNLIRKTSLDELPQLLNILRGEMSLVGPRPIVRDELDRYRLARVYYLRARPGLTGLWQISGRNETSYEQRVQLDKRYVLNWSFWSDLAIVLKTIPALLFARGVY